MKTLTGKKIDVSLRDEWLRTVEELQQQITLWVADEPEWSISEGEDHQIEEESLGIYSVTSVNIYTPDGRLVLEPIARNYPGRGIVELYAWPTLYRVRLIRDMTVGGWRVRTDSGISLRQEWNRESFVILANDLLAADA